MDNPLLSSADMPKFSVIDQIASADGGGLSREELRRRAGSAMQRKLPLFTRCINEAREWVIVGGGPSAAKCFPEIRRLKRRGANVVTVNKSHDWLLEHGIVPWGHVLLDWNPWVADYVKRPRIDVRYFVASQCVDQVFDNLAGYPVFLWHAGQDFPEGDEPSTFLRQNFPNTPWKVLPGGTTVGLRTPLIGHILGADRFHLFGFDSSRGEDGKLHPYPKNEPAGATTGTILVKHNGAKVPFETNSHMARQQFDFDQLIEELPKHYAAGRYRKEFSLTFYGSGLLPFMAAKLGLHADPKCNEDPMKVGGFAPQPLQDLRHFPFIEFSPLVPLNPDDFPTVRMQLLGKAN